jgi:nitrogenase molybdenum-iron protein NifN
MTDAAESVKACTVNPLKVSPAVGAALAFMGVDGAMPLLHGGQGCTAFAIVLLVRHFREAMPLQTTAMSELSTILGGADNVEQAIGNIHQRVKPRVIGLLSTALTETRGEDMAGDLKVMRQRHPEWDGLAVVFASVPDYLGGLESGWAAAVEAIIDEMVPPGDGTRALRQVNLLAGSQLTPFEVEALTDIIGEFGLTAVVLPDLSRALDGFVPDQHVGTSLGGVGAEAIAAMGRSKVTLAVGRRMAAPAAALERRTGVPYAVFDSVTGLAASDAFVAALMEASGREPGERVKRERSRLVDVMLDGHFTFDERRIAIAGDPDLLAAYVPLLAGLGAEVTTAIASEASPVLDGLPAARVRVGDLDDLETLAAGTAASGVDLLIGNSHVAPAAARLGLPLWRAGFPVFDRLGAGRHCAVGYRGSADLICNLANLLMERQAHGHAHEQRTDTAVRDRQPAVARG